MGKENKRKFEGEWHNYKPLQRASNGLNDREYIDKRLNDQIKWLKDESEVNGKKYKKRKTIDTGLALIVSIMLAIHATITGAVDSDDPTNSGYMWVKLLTAAIGVAIAISAGFAEVEGLEHKAKDYKRLYKKLETQKFKYLTRTEPYDEEDAFRRLVLNVENLIHLDVMHYFQKAEPPQPPAEPKEERNEEEEIR